LFSREVGVFTTTIPLPLTRTYALVFEGGGDVFTTTTIPLSRNRAYALVFEGVVVSSPPPPFPSLETERTRSFSREVQ
jgi:hypothetical protein